MLHKSHLFEDKTGKLTLILHVLLHVCAQVSSIDKMHCLKRTCDAIFCAIETQYGTGNVVVTFCCLTSMQLTTYCQVGADDLLPLLSYVMIQVTDCP